MGRLRSAVAIAVTALCLGSAAACPQRAESTPKDAATCGMPTAAPFWIDFADGSVPFWSVFARPGVIGAGSSPTVLPQLRAAGAATVYFDLYMKYRVGTLTEPLDTETVIAKSNELYEMAVMRTGCPTPRIAENELFSANFPAPWSAEAAQYRANVLTMVKTLAGRGAHPYLLLSRPPAADAVATAWWRELAEYSDFVPEVYFPATQIFAQGRNAGSRRMRVAIRRAITAFTALGVPASKLGFMLGFQVALGAGGREGLEPEASWYRVVKWQALAAKQIAREYPIDSIWSWGWGTWSDETDDPDKEVAACVYLWTRSQELCDALSVAGPDFNSSLTEGQINLPAGVRCLVDSRALRNAQVAALARVTGDNDAALSALFAHTVESGLVKVPPGQVPAVERAIVKLRFKGSRAAYARALAAAGASPALARTIIGDELRRRTIAASLKVAKPSESTIRDYYDSQTSQLVRLVSVESAPAWLGGRKRGYALASLAPKTVFQIKDGSESSVRTTLGIVKVTALGPVKMLGSMSLSTVRAAIRAALIGSARDDAFAKWTVGRQTSALGRTRCTLDRMPLPSPAELDSYLPFLSLRDAFPLASPSRVAE